MRNEEIFEHVHSRDIDSNCQQERMDLRQSEDPVSFRAKHAAAFTHCNSIRATETKSILER